MRLRLCRLCLLAATVAATAWAQTAPPVPAASGSRIPPTKSTGKSTKPARTGVPDPDLLDGSAFEKEKRPMEGMLSEIEMGEKEGPKGAKISPESGPSGSQSQSPDQNDPTKMSGGGAESASQSSQQGGAGGSPDQSQQQSGGSPSAGGPSAQAQGTQVSDLKVPEGAQAAGGEQSTAPRNLQIGDATLQIQTVEKSAVDVVGVESSSAQQYEKKLPSGGAQTDNRNRGVEKGRSVPKGL